MLNSFHRRSLKQVAATSFLVLGIVLGVSGQTDSPFRVGEKLSYTLSFGQFKDGGYAELYVASRGKIARRDAVEIRSRVKTIGVVSASFMLIDENRTVFADPSTGMPLFIRRTENNGAIPREISSNYLTTPSSNFDLSTLIYRARAMGGVGTYTFAQGDRISTISFLPGGTEHLRTDAGDFDTTVVSVQSEFLASKGFRDIKLNLSADEQRIPVLLRFKAQKSEFRATIASIALDQPTGAVDPTASPTPLPIATPIPIPTPRQNSPAAAYVENEPLLPELGFALGEKLNYRISAGGQALASIVLEAVERRKFMDQDSLLLTATVTAVDRPNSLFRPGDTMRAQVDPDTLAPRWTEGKFGPGLGPVNQTATFDPQKGITFGGTKTVEAPVGTHSLLSLIYAMRSFNLQFSRDNKNPINDTRVAVFFENKTYVFTLRPEPSSEITINGRKVLADLVNIKTDNPQLDALALKVWLAADTRLPLRISAGAYQADLIQN